MNRTLLAGVVLAMAAVSYAADPPVTPLAQLPKIDAAALLANTKVLASDEFEGRLPGTRGEDKTVAFLVEQFQRLGLEPGNPDGTYLQKVPLVGITPDPATTLTVAKGSEQRRLKFKDEVVVWTKHVDDTVSVADSEMVFVGYGVVAPEYQWNDFKDVDVKGKTVVMLVGDPPVSDPANPAELDPKTFGGRAMTYYGRWTYKYEIGAEKGAAAVLIVHETGPAGYPFAVVQGKTAEQFDLVTPDRNRGRAKAEGWLSLDATRAVLAMAGQDFDALKKKALDRSFRPVPLGLKASVTINNEMRTVDSRNVIARLEGSDPRRKDEHVIYTAHWDHFGIADPIGGDKIYNGAVDNATGTAGLLEIARAFKRLPVAPRRSILFLAVTAEEQGLLGSQYYAVTPLHPLAKTVAAINMDAPNVHGRTKDVTVIGLGNSTLDDYVAEAAREQGRVVKGDAEPEKGFYYRSDHFNFAKQGVPSLYTDEGVEFVGKPAGYGQKMRDDYTTNRYHKPSDEVLPSWDLSGMAEDMSLLFAVGYRVAQAEAWPEWRPGTEFKARRDQMLRR